MIAGQRQAGEYHLRSLLRRDAIRRQRIADDLVILLGIEAALVDVNAGAARGPLRDPIAETLDDIGTAGSIAVLERCKKAARRRFVVPIDRKAELL
jgi:hypothetical protein